MFKVSIIDIEKGESIFAELVSSLILPGEEGEFSVLDFHQAMVSVLKEGTIQINESNSISIRKGIAKIQGNEILILARL
jgi:F0F1-type ATP synthase epsilon subunit